MKVDKEECRDLDRALSLEWLETNGLGGFSSGTVAGANTRRYHALLLTARKPPSERFVLVNHLDEWLEVDGQTIPISTNLYPNAIHPEGYKQCTGFTTDPWPTWTYHRHGTVVQREVFCVRGRDLVVIRWTLAGHSKKAITLRVRPMVSGRDYHATHHMNDSLLTTATTVADGLVSWRPYSGLSSVQAFQNGGYRHDPTWIRTVQFPAEQQRGLDFEEDWWSPGEFTYRLDHGAAATLVLTTESIDSVDVAVLTEGERKRRAGLRASAPTTDSLAGELWCAVEAYLSARGSRQTVIAGYPWFIDWGRDTFISLPGLCLVTGRWEIAWQTIESFAAHISQGMVPNRFPDIGEQPEYNTIDASLWFVHAIERYFVYSKDEARVREVAWPAVRQIIDGYRQGTRYDIHMDEDGLIAGGIPGSQLTWMDAKVGDWVITPRHGKPVEIQALWTRALEIGERLATKFGEPAYAERCREDRKQAVASFRAKFWNEAGGYLYDVIDGPEGDDASIRPNQIYTIALCDDLVTKEQAQRILRVVEEHLLTPVGLRTLSPKDNRYRPRYEGGVVERDGAYHQGTVWPFLLGPYVTAWRKVNGNSPAKRAEARAFLNGLEGHLHDACLGQVSEIFDAEAPHHARGCFAQAWSVAEPLRILIEELDAKAEARPLREKRVVIRRRKETPPPQKK
ncbi:MAG: glycogen debranching enzyme N-terminal domain-containing protein [Nitrospirae bacterium]|nr:glycogen debranching enzyme N-terminal domain-containing protein [Nitrospirota bacterium]MDE3048856.1 glycogen debranching enzyme family protein [Nitrospirota bacterium]